MQNASVIHSHLLVLHCKRLLDALDLEVMILVDIVPPYGALQRVGIYHKHPPAGGQKYSPPVFVTAMLQSNLP